MVTKEARVDSIAAHSPRSRRCLFFESAPPEAGHSLAPTTGTRPVRGLSTSPLALFYEAGGQRRAHRSSPPLLPSVPSSKKRNVEQVLDK